MSGVKRYRPLHKQVMVYIRETDYCTYADSPGDMVLASDYDALAQRCAELEADLTEQADLLKEAIEQRDSLDRLQSDECFSRENTEVERDTLRAEITAYQTALADERGRHATAEMALRDEVERLRQFVEFVRHAPVSSGVCCCGDNMANHPDPVCCGHSPVDEWDYALLGWLKELGVEQ